VLAFRRPNGWLVVANFGVADYEIDAPEAILASSDAPIGVVPPETTVWIWEA